MMISRPWIIAACRNLNNQNSLVGATSGEAVIKKTIGSEGGTITPLVTVTDLGEDDGFLRGAFDVSPAQGKFRVKIAPQ